MNIVVVGGGFAGVKAALELSKRQVGKITLVSDEPYFLHHATLYATATGRDYAESILPLAAIFANHPNVTVVVDKMTSLDERHKLVVGEQGHYRYDKLILALGSVTNYFGISGMQDHAYGIKTLEEVRKFKEHIHDEVVHQKLDKEYYVIGAGPSGVELAGALQEYLHSLITTYRLKKRRTRVTLVEAAPAVLGRLSKSAHRLVSKQLKRHGVRVLLNQKVQALDVDKITIEDKKYPTTTAVWTSGVANNPFFAQYSELFSLAPNGRVNVNGQLEGAKDIYVIGDNNTVKYSGMAWPALGQAKFVAKDIARVITKRHRPNFVPKSAPCGVPVGESWAYVEWHGLYISGKAGAWTRRMMELYGYAQMVPLHDAIKVWRAHDIAEVDA